MTKQQIYETNIQLQNVISEIVFYCHIQNQDKVVRTFTDMTAMLMNVLDAVFADMDFYNREMELVNPDGISASLQDIMTAQANKDYVLLGDLLQLQLLPFIGSLQEAIRCYEPAGLNETVWQKNMQALEKKDASLWKAVKAYHEKYEQENAAGTYQGMHHLEDTNSGAFTLAGEDEKGAYYYHSNVDPYGEANDFARYYYDEDASAYMIWGLGLAYHICALAKQDEGAMITVFESDMDVIYHCVMTTDLSGLMENGVLTLVYDSDFSKVVNYLGADTENFIIHAPSLRHIADAKIRKQMEMFFMRDSGKRNMAATFASNSRENFKHYDGSVDALQSAFEGKHVVIVAAGPSLDKNVELLKNKPENVIVLATGTVFRKLLSLGIDVDYVIVTDANARVYGQIGGLEDQQIPMLYLSTAYRGFSMYYKGKKYIICQDGYDKAESLAKENGWRLYGTGGSVSTTALDVCIQMNCQSIAFVGLDLAYTEGMAHAQGTSRRVAEEAEEMEQVPAVGGGMVPASKLFQIYNRWIANRVKEKDVNMPVYDATEGGAVVPGLAITSLKEYIEGVRN